MSGSSAPRILRRLAVRKPHTYERPARLGVNDWAPSGDWTVSKDAAALNKAGGIITYRFHARDLHLVMGGAWIVREIPRADRRTAARRRPWGRRRRARLQHGDRTADVSVDPATGPIADRRFEVEFFGPGAEVFAFTFD